MHLDLACCLLIACSTKSRLKCNGAFDSISCGSGISGYCGGGSSSSSSSSSSNCSGGSSKQQAAGAV